MKVTCHPGLGGALAEGGGHWNTIVSFKYYLINSTDFSINGCI